MQMICGWNVKHETSENLNKEVKKQKYRTKYSFLHSCDHVDSMDFKDNPTLFDVQNPNYIYINFLLKQLH